MMRTETAGARRSGGGLRDIKDEEVDGVVVERQLEAEAQVEIEGRRKAG